MTLRTRLLASYLLLLTLTLGVIVIALLLLLNARAEPDSETYQRITYIARGFDVDELVDEFNQLQFTPTIPGAFQNQRNVRWLILVGDTVIGDSNQTLSLGDKLHLIEDNDYVPPYPEREILALNDAVFGKFYDPDGTKWFYLATDKKLRVNFRSVRATIVLADVPSSRTLQSTLTELGSALMTPVLQSAVIGLVVAVILAGLISRTIARPLQTFAHAATDIAQGNYDGAVPVAGPPEVREVAIAFNQMSADVRDTQQAQRDFMANVSHDLKTPLTSIQGYSQAIIDGTVKDPTRAAEIIYEEAGRLNRMVAELSDLARLQAGGIVMRRDPVDIGQMTQSIVERLQVVAERKNIAIYTDVYVGLLITGDGDRLSQVLTNLISNAIKYTPEGGKVWVSTSFSNNGVKITVRDNGIGIPRSELPRIFERFYQIDKARGPLRGNGLGLAIAREIVHAHGGEIQAESLGEGSGSTFSVWLPLNRQLVAEPMPS